MKSELMAACDQLAAASANGLYQGMLVALLVGAVLKLARRNNAATRHAVWFGALVVLAGLMSAHLWRAERHIVDAHSESLILAKFSTQSASPDSLAEPISIPTQPTSDSPNPSPDNDEFAANPDFDWTLPPSQVAGSESDPDDLLALLPSTEPIDPVSAANQDSAGATVPSDPGILYRLFRIASAPVTWSFSFGNGVAKLTSAILLGAWLCIAILKLALMISRLVKIRNLKSWGATPNGALEEIFQQLRASLSPNRQVQLRISPTPGSPMVLGFLHPVILMPMEEFSASTEQILRHELAHVRRRDDWANLVQQLIQALLFFHPAVWWISRQLTLEREIACDDHVLQQTGQPRAYALLLAELAGRMRGPAPSLAPGATTNKTQLQQRIDMILDIGRNSSPRLAKMRLGFITSCAALLALAAIYLAPRVVLAQSAGAAAEAAAPTKPVPESAPVATVSLPGVAVAAPAAENATVTLTGPGGATLVAVTGDEPGAPPGAAAGGPRFKALAPPAPGAALPVPPRPAFGALVPISPVAGLPAVIAPGLPPLAPVPAGSLVATVEPQDQPSLPRTPRPARSPRAENPGGLEDRLSRLEQLVESLCAQQPGAAGFGQYKLRKDLTDIDRKELLEKMDRAKRDALRMKPEVWRTPDDNFKYQAEEAERHAEMAKREAEVAKDQAKQYARDLNRETERVVRDKERNASRNINKDAARKQLEALRRQVENLERQREKLGREIEELERRQGQMDEMPPEEKKGGEKSDNHEDGKKAIAR